jgi:hypothetical protein
MDPEALKRIRISRGLRNILASIGVLLLVPSLLLAPWGILLGHTEDHRLVMIAPGGFLLGLILIGFAIRAGKKRS